MPKSVHRAIVIALVWLLIFVGFAWVMLNIAYSAEYQDKDGVKYPDPEMTPGRVYTEVDLAQLCHVGYPAKVRHVDASTKRRILNSYNIPWSDRNQYEIDHFIPLGLGGTNEDRNLWPQPYKSVGAREKDVVELYMRRLVCRGEMTLFRAQDLIKLDWYNLYKGIKKEEDERATQSYPK